VVPGGGCCCCGVQPLCLLTLSACLPVGLAAGGYVGYALTTAWDEGEGCVAAAAAGPDPADPCHDDDSRPHSMAAVQQQAAGPRRVRALQVRLRRHQAQALKRGALCKLLQ